MLPLMVPERPEADPPRGVLRTPPQDGHIEHRRLLPRASLTPFVAHFWSVRWDLASPFEAETLPHPSVHLVFEARDAAPLRAEIRGVMTGRFTTRLEGCGEVFGIKLRPAAFPLGVPMARLTDRVAPLDRAFGDAALLAGSVLAAPDLEAKIAAAESFFEPRLPPLCPEAILLRDLVERVATDRTLLRVEDLARLVDLDVRTLQRRFRHYVGVSPKWVIQRYRLHEAAERLKAARPPSLAALAAELGYADQSHFARDFKRMIGRTPRSFATGARLRTEAEVP